MKNRFGLARNIPSEIAREVRQRSKFGCVICRAGIFEYEHISVNFSNASKHNADDICCLCGSCHSKVTRGIYSKDFVRMSYDKIRNAKAEDVRRPFDNFDFHSAPPQIRVGGLSYDKQLKSIIRYHGIDFLAISPITEHEEYGINALFLDDDGNETLRIDGQVWNGSVSSWDTEVIGNRISIRKRKGVFSLRLRLEPPNQFIIEQLDMRIRDVHVLCSEHAYAVGRYFEHRDPYWYTVIIRDIEAPLGGACAIEFLTPLEIEWRDIKWRGKGHRMETEDRHAVFQTGLGVTFKPLGVVIASNCLKFKYGGSAWGGPRSVAKMRRAVFSNSERLLQFIGEGFP